MLPADAMAATVLRRTGIEAVPATISYPIPGLRTLSTGSGEP
jgi:hypothetical protein